nr:DUF2243 domain-containing protein [uncultured Noviherbaspirillum sp.]
MPEDPGTMSPALAPRRLRWAGDLIGIALGGFFDGILLHQVLQWHHLLSLVDSPVLRDIRAQIGRSMRRDAAMR